MYAVCEVANEPMSQSAHTEIRHRETPHADLASRLDRLEEECPTNYGYLVRKWAEVREGLEATGQNYPSAKQVHEAIEEAESTPRTVGPALKALESLGVIGLWSESVGANRYDLTEYEQRTSDALGELIDVRAEE
jgi:hypothetical protein